MCGNAPVNIYGYIYTYMPVQVQNDSDTIGSSLYTYTQRQHKDTQQGARALACKIINSPIYLVKNHHQKYFLKEVFQYWFY